MTLSSRTPRCGKAALGIPQAKVRRRAPAAAKGRRQLVGRGRAGRGGLPGTTVNQTVQTRPATPPCLACPEHANHGAALALPGALTKLAGRDRRQGRGGIVGHVDDDQRRGLQLLHPASQAGIGQAVADGGLRQWQTEGLQGASTVTAFISGRPVWAIPTSGAGRVIIPVTFILVTTKIDADLTQAGAEAPLRFAMVDGGLGSPLMAGLPFAIDADFLHRHRLPGIPEPVAVIQGNGGDQGDVGFHHIGGISRPQPHFQQEHRARRGETPQTRQGGELEEGEGDVAPGGFHLGKGRAVIAIGSSWPLTRTRSVKRSRWGE